MFTITKFSSLNPELTVHTQQLWQFFLCLSVIIEVLYLANNCVVHPRRCSLLLYINPQPTIFVCLSFSVSASDGCTIVFFTFRKYSRLSVITVMVRRIGTDNQKQRINRSTHIQAKHTVSLLFSLLIEVSHLTDL